MSGSLLSGRGAVFTETAAAVEASGLRALTYAHPPGWESPHLQAAIHYGYWVVERPRPVGQGTPSVARA